jgi:branched-chain amino acid aminotransferase
VRYWCRDSFGFSSELVEAAKNGTLKEIFGAGTAAVVNNFEDSLTKMFIMNYQKWKFNGFATKNKAENIQNKLEQDIFGWTVKV